MDPLFAVMGKAPSMFTFTIPGFGGVHRPEFQIDVFLVSVSNVVCWNRWWSSASVNARSTSCAGVIRWFLKITWFLAFHICQRRDAIVSRSNLLDYQNVILDLSTSHEGTLFFGNQLRIWIWRRLLENVNLLHLSSAREVTWSLRAKEESSSCLEAQVSVTTFRQFWFWSQKASKVKTLHLLGGLGSVSSYNGLWLEPRVGNAKTSVVGLLE